jgi:hypothetical protein
MNDDSLLPSGEKLPKPNGAANPTPPIESAQTESALPPQSELPPQSAGNNPKRLLKWMKRGKRSAVWAWKLFAELVTILWLLALWDSYRPKITLVPGITHNQKNPFDTVFIVQNQGALPIENVKYNATWLYGGPISQRPPNQHTFTVYNVTKIPQMKPLECYSFMLNYDYLKPEVLPKGQPLVLWFDITYEPKFFGKRTDTLYFHAEQDVEGIYQWLPSGHEDINAQPIFTNIVGYGPDRK